MKTIEFTSEQKVFTNDKGQSIDYTDRRIVIDGTRYKVSKIDGQVFDYQFKDLINNGPVDIEE